MIVNVVGLGYIGLPTACILSYHGNKVIGTDINHNLITRLKAGKYTQLDQEIADMLLDYGGELEFSLTPVSAEIYIICVPTPFITESKKIDLQYVSSAVSSIMDVVDDNAIIVIESTIAPGTMDNILVAFSSKSNKNVSFAYCPERVLPGAIWNELVNNSRVIGVNDEEVGEVVRKLYSMFCVNSIIVTDFKTAELAKLVENSYRDINIAFANSIALIANKLNISSGEVIKIANQHPRVNILSPGPGVGGHCIPVDPWFLISEFPKETVLIRTSREINDFMPYHVVDKISKIVLIENISIKKIGFYGTTYKANTKDLRESPSIKIINIFNEVTGVYPRVFEPTDFINSSDLNEEFHIFINEIDLLVILVDHKQLFDVKDEINKKLIFDTKNVSYIDSTYKL
jgi:UDP-N-acetyl-D-mannosaminuronic acid dehydrogenase